jgi:hypothetical protein
MRPGHEPNLMYVGHFSHGAALASQLNPWAKSLQKQREHIDMWSFGSYLLSKTISCMH